MMFNPKSQTMRAIITQPWPYLWEDDDLGQARASAQGLQRQTHPVVRRQWIFRRARRRCRAASGGACGWNSNVGL